LHGTPPEDLAATLASPRIGGRQPGRAFLHVLGADEVNAYAIH
jgi:hypothetical protein